MSDIESTGAELMRLAPDIVLHLAGEAVTGRVDSDPIAVWRANVRQPVVLAEAILRHRPETVLLFVSSAAVYGLSCRDHAAVDESAAMQPANVYAVTKAAADLAIGEMALRGLRSIRLRPFNHTGPGQSADFVIPALARQVARIESGRQEPVIRTGSLESARDFLDVRDVCRAYVEAARRSATIPAGTILNIASGTARRIAETLDRLLEIAGVEARIEAEPARLRANDVPVMRGDAAKARELLGWEPRLPFDQTLRETLDWWRGRVAAET